MPAVRLRTLEDVHAFVERLFDPQRDEPVVLVTTRHRMPDPLIDAEALATAVSPLPVHVVTTGELTWELTGLLPDGLGVFGGAARIWWPGLTRRSERHDHPLVFAYSPAEGATARERLEKELLGVEREAEGDRRRRRWRGERPRPDAPAKDQLTGRPYPVGTVVAGAVSEATAGGAEVEVAPGLSGWLIRRRHDPDRAVGDRVDVRIRGYDEQGVLLERASRPRVPEEAPAQEAPEPEPPAASAASMVEMVALRHQLATAEQARVDAEARARSAEAELSEALRTAGRTARELRREVKALKGKVTHLEAELRGTGRHEDPKAQFRHEVEVAWDRTCVGEDRVTWPLQEFTLGPYFLSTLVQLEGVPREKVVEVCVDVITGRAAEMSGRELHPLRTDEGGDSRQLVRPDGARAFRVALQVKTPSARRLHFWRLPSGSVELANVGVHDDVHIF